MTVPHDAGTHCPTCAAPIREESSKFCAFCGTKLPEAPKPPVVVVREWAPTAPERFEAARRHPDFDRMMALTPSTASETFSRWLLVCACGLLTLFAIFLLATALGPRGTRGFPIVLCLFGLALCVALTWGSTLRALRFAAAPMTRAIAVVVDERVNVTGGKHASTSYFASLEFEDGARVEIEVGEELASGLARNDIGVVYLKRGVLIGFTRIPLR